VIPNKGFRPPIWATIYISVVNEARKVKSDTQVATNKNSDPVPPNRIFQTRKLIFGLHINMDKDDSHRYDVTR